MIKKLLKFVKEQFQESNIAPKRICFEITETAAISNLNEALSFIKEMRDFGCQFALDDFGSGFSSFIYLTRFKVDYLKIDGNLVRTMTVDNTRQAMVKAINDIGHAMEIHTIAEFVETEADIALLKELKVDYAQGYAVSRPAPLETLTRIRPGLTLPKPWKLSIMSPIPIELWLLGDLAAFCTY